jgi:hypothetical protein
MRTERLQHRGLSCARRPNKRCDPRPREDLERQGLLAPRYLLFGVVLVNRFIDHGIDLRSPRPCHVDSACVEPRADARLDELRSGREATKLPATALASRERYFYECRLESRPRKLEELSCRIAKRI